MRFMIASATALALLLVSSVAGAYEITASLKAGSNDPASIEVGDSFVYEIFLDTEGESDIILISVAYTYDPSVARYDKVNSRSNSYYPLYAPSPAKGQPATWMEPSPFFDGNYCSLGNELCSNAPSIWVGSKPPIGGQVNMDFVATGLAPTISTASNLKLSEIHFNAVGPGSFNPDFSFDYGGNVFSIDGTDISDPGYMGPLVVDATLVDGTAVSVPEPGLAGLALGALGTVGVLATRRRRS